MTKNAYLVTFETFDPGAVVGVEARLALKDDLGKAVRASLGEITSVGVDHLDPDDLGNVRYIETDR